MPLFSNARDAVFTPLEKPVYVVGDFPDFYAILGVRQNAAPSAILDAILERGSELLAVSFARGGGGEHMTLVQKYQPFFRDVLLSDATRRDYDALLYRHREGLSAVSMDEFLKPLLPRPKRKWFSKKSI